MIKIGIIAAVRDEAEPLANVLNLSPKEVDGTFSLWSNASETIILLTPGEDADFKSGSGNHVGRPGKVSAGIITAILIERYAPDTIINAGTAAGIAAKGVAVGDVVVADNVANHDIHIPLPGYSEYGKRKIPLDVEEVTRSLTLPHKLGTVSSAESFTSTHEEWQTMTENDVMAKEMEAAGVLQSAQILGYKKPVYVVKALTDRENEQSSDEDQTSDYETNFAIAMNALTAFVVELISYLRNNK